MAQELPSYWIWLQRLQRGSLTQREVRGRVWLEKQGEALVTRLPQSQKKREAGKVRIF
jgi:hypothetical protein